MLERAARGAPLTALRWSEKPGGGGCGCAESSGECGCKSVGAGDRRVPGGPYVRWRSGGERQVAGGPDRGCTCGTARRGRRQRGCAGAYRSMGGPFGSPPPEDTGWTCDGSDCTRGVYYWADSPLEVWCPSGQECLNGRCCTWTGNYPGSTSDPEDRPPIEETGRSQLSNSGRDPFEPQCPGASRLTNCRVTDARCLEDGSCQVWEECDLERTDGPDSGPHCEWSYVRDDAFWRNAAAFECNWIGGCGRGGIPFDAP
jgi:hypothetical protein